jgi:hypothetical protein
MPPWQVGFLATTSTKGVERSEQTERSSYCAALGAILPTEIQVVDYKGQNGRDSQNNDRARSRAATSAGFFTLAKYWISSAKSGALP